MAELTLSAIALGVLGFTAQLLVQRLPQQPYLAPLLLVLLTLMIVLSGPVIFQLAPALTFNYIAILPVAFFALLPSMYFYAQALTANKEWRWQRRYIAEYWTQLLAIPLALLIYTLPAAEQQALFFSESAQLQGQSLLTAITFFAATLLWLGLSTFYLIRITMQLRRYRQQLREVFAADSGKRLHWLNGLIVALLLSWSYAALVFVAGERLASPWLSDTGVMILALILVWLLCIGGLQQQPGFAELFSATTNEEPVESVVEEPKPEDAIKYQRSALGEEQAKRIAGKAHHAVYEERLYLDSALTLYKLAAHIGVSAQYLSQTLNQTLQQSFYDYINDARITAAKQQLQHTDDSVLSIAMAVGFNARSSFYKAFKSSTGLTPAQYRAQKSWNS